MAVNTVFFKNSGIINQLTAMRSQFDSLQQQLSTGKVATTYGGLGQNRSLDLSLKQRLGEVGSYQNTIDYVDLRMNVLDRTIGRMDAIRGESRTAIDPNNFVQQADGSTNSQTSAKVSLVEMMGLLNSDVGGRQLYSGAAVDTAPVANYDLIMDGDQSHAGLKRVMDEYRQADAGPLGNGRLASTRTAGTVTLAEDGTHDFGFKIAGANSTLANVSTSYTAGPPAQQAVDFTGQPAVGQKITLYLDLPDGTKATLALHVASKSGENGGFELGDTPQDTAQNFQDALDTALSDKASSELKAASLMRGSQIFFDTYQGKAVARIDGPPYDTAIATRDGSADTVAWYLGDQTTTDPRSGSSANIDDNFRVNYGARANEEGFRSLLQSVAAFVASDFSGDSEEDHAFYTAMASRSQDALRNTDGKTSAIQKIQMEIATTHLAVQKVADRHATTQKSLEVTLDDIEGVNTTEVATQVLQLQTMMELSYRTTSILYQLNLANYL